MESELDTDTRSLTTQGITVPYTLLILLSVAGLGVTLYLTNHYMQVHFPQGIVEPSACDINQTFNCDASTLSPVSNIFGIPISALGLLFFLNLFIFLHFSLQLLGKIQPRPRLGQCYRLRFFIHLLCFLS